MKKRDILLDFVDSNGKEHRYEPMALIEALNDACEEMNYSNYHNNQFERIKFIIKEWAKDRNIKLGLTAKQREQKYKEKMANDTDYLKEILAMIKKD